MSFVFTTQHQLFIQKMLESQEQEHKGFELLLSKDFFAEFFEHLLEAGLFNASRNLGPATAYEQGFVTIPYWPPLDYLFACAKHAHQYDNTDLAQKILFVVRSCSNYRNAEGQPIHNYHSNKKFVAIMAALSTELLTLEDIALIQQWLLDPYEQGIVCKEVDEELLPKLLLSDSKDDWAKAVKVLDFCTQLLPGKSADEFITVADDYWLKQLLMHHVVALGTKAGKETADIFFNRLTDLFGKENRLGLDYLYRAAIEDHPQNRDWYAAENRCVEGLRDILLSWLDVDLNATLTYLKSLVASDLLIARRIGFHVINHKWDSCKQLFVDSISHDIFKINLTHEVYQLLNAHFADLDSREQNLILDLIKTIKVSDNTDDPQKTLKIEQRRWLSAIKGKGNKYVDDWFESLGNGEGAVGISPNPDFHLFMESRWGDGDSPYQSDEILAFLRDCTLITRLNSFQQTDRWEGPTTRALVNTLESTVAKNPELFLRSISTFILAEPAYQYGLISGLKQAWVSSEKESTSLDWNDAWLVVIDFICNLISSYEFWDTPAAVDGNWTPDRDWIPPLVAEFLRSGTKNDKHALPNNLMPDVLFLIKILLSKTLGLTEPSEDPMTAAINSAKGKAIEALFSHTLRSCRVSQTITKDHSLCWTDVEEIYNNELNKSRLGNYEFSTLVAAYLANFEYMSLDWLKKNILRIFPLDCPENFDAAVGGLAYANATSKTYRLLIDSGVIDHALEQYKGKAKFEDKLVERIALAYLWGEEQINSPRFTFWFESNDYPALQGVTNFFWSVHRQEMSNAQVKLIIEFWRYCVDRVRDDSLDSKSLLSSLGRLAIYLEEVTPDDLHRLLLIAPHHRLGHNSDWLIEGLEKLSSTSPKEVSEILNLVLEGYQPAFDFEGRLANIALNLAKAGLKVEALHLVDSVRHLRDMNKLFDHIKGI